MYVRAALSAVHLLGLAIGLGAVYARGRALSRRDVAAVLFADNWWGISALVLLGSGLARAFAGFEKGSAYYLASDAFWLKMGLFGLVLALEAWPMVTFVRWRIARGRGGEADVSRAGALWWVNTVEVALVVAIPFVAAAMARGA